MSAVLFVVAAILATLTFFYFAHQTAHAPTSGKPRRRYRLEPSSSMESLLLWSPALCALTAVIVFSIPLLDQLAMKSLAIVLDRVCNSSLPTLWCWKSSWPSSWFLVIHVAVYLWFLGMSAYLVFSIMTGRIPKPLHYVEGSFPLGGSLAFAGFWLFMVAGGQLILQTRLGHLFPYFGLFLCTAALCGALSGWRVILMALKYRRPQTST